MQSKEMIIDALLEVLKRTMLRGEDSMRVMNQIGYLCEPKLTAITQPLFTKSSLEAIGQANG